MNEAEAFFVGTLGDPFGLVSVPHPHFEGAATLASAYPVSSLTSASTAVAGLALSDLLAVLGWPGRPVTVVRHLADRWFAAPVRPLGWTLPSPWDQIAGDYAARDGWIRLHTNAPRHRAAALAVLGVAADRDAVTAAVGGWFVDELEAAVVAAGGAAAGMRSAHEWTGHPQGVAVAAEPLVRRLEGGRDTADSSWEPAIERPLTGLRVLDLTRVLAGPSATRLLAGLGADVLRIDPPDWDEPAVVLVTGFGKRSARLDARKPEGLERLRALLAGADVVVHGYRPGALATLGLDSSERAQLRPGLVDVSLTAYGQSGPWAGRRGFDSLVQMSAGIADTGMRSAGAGRPVPLPVQALDYATGNLLAAAVLSGLRDRVRGGAGSSWRASLARTAVELERGRAIGPDVVAEPPSCEGREFETGWGPVELLAAPVRVGGVDLAWPHGSYPLGSDEPTW